MSDEIDMNRDAAPAPDLPMTLDAMANDRRSAMLRQLIAPHTITQSSPDVPRQAMPDMVMLAYIKESTGQTTQQVLEWASRNNVTQSPIEAGPFGRPQFGATQLPPINVQMLDKYVNSFHWRNLRESVDSTVTPEYRRQLGLDPLPQRRNGIIPEGIEHTTNTSEVTATLLEHNQGIAFADEHSDYASVEELTKHINTLREQGVKVLFIEMVRSNFQDSLNAYMQTGDPNTPDNNGYTLDKGGLNQRWDNYAPGQRQNYFDLIETARAAGLEVVGIDTVDANGERFITSNQHWADIVSARAAALGPNEKYAVFGGRDHFAKGVDTGEYSGRSVTDILNIPTVELTTDPEHAGKISTQVGMHDAKYVRVSLPKSPRQLQIGDIADYETPPLQKRVPPVLAEQQQQQPKHVDAVNSPEADARTPSDSYRRAVLLDEQINHLDAQCREILERAKAYADESGYRRIAAKQYETGLAALTPEERARYSASSIDDKSHDPVLQEIHNKLFSLGTDALTPEERKILIDVPAVTIPVDAELGRLADQIQLLKQEHSALIRSIAADDGEFHRALDRLNLRSENGVWRFTGTPEMLSEQIVETGLRNRGIPVTLSSNNTFERGVPSYAQFNGDRAMALETFEARMVDAAVRPAAQVAPDAPTEASRRRASEMIAQRLGDELRGLKSYESHGFSALAGDQTAQVAAYVETAKALVASHPDLRPEHISFLSAGSSAQAFAISDREVLRVTNALTEEAGRAPTSAALHPTTQSTIANGMLRVETMQRVTPLAEAIRVDLGVDALLDHQRRNQEILGHLSDVGAAFALDGLVSDDLRHNNVGMMENGRGERIAVAFDSGPYNPQDLTRIGHTLSVKDLGSASRRYGEQITTRDRGNLGIEETRHYAMNRAGDFAERRMQIYIDSLSHLPNVGVEGAVTINGQRYALNELSGASERIISGTVATIKAGGDVSVHLDVDPAARAQFMDRYVTAKGATANLQQSQALPDPSHVAPQSLTHTVSIASDIQARQLMPLADIRHGSYTSDRATMYHPEEMARIAKRIGLDVPVADLHSLSVRSEGGQLHLDIEFKTPEAQRAAVANGLGESMQRATETLLRDARLSPEQSDALRAHERTARERALAPAPGERVDPLDFGRKGGDGVSEASLPMASTSEVAPRPALSAEPAGWLERDLTVREALTEHTQTWFGQGASPDPFHDPVHVIAALAGAHPHQGSYEAEMHAVAIEQGLSPGHQDNPPSMSTPRVYVDTVRSNADAFAGHENMNRTLLWAMGAQNGQTSDDIYRGLHHDNERLIAAAKEMGIESHSTNEVHNEWTVKLPDGTAYAFSDENPQKTVLPTGSNGVETFTPFAVPPEEKIIPIFERVKPVLQDLQPQIDAVHDGSNKGPTRLDMMGDIKVRAIDARMSGTGAPLKISSRYSEATRAAEDRAEQPAMINAEPEPQAQAATEVTHEAATSDAPPMTPEVPPSVLPVPAEGVAHASQIGHAAPVTGAAAAAALAAGAAQASHVGGHGGDGHVRSVHGVSAGAGAALGIYGLSQKMGSEGTLRKDLNAGGAQAALAATSTAFDGSAIVADTLGVLRSRGSLGAAARQLALPVAIAAGALETGTAIAARDGHRAATAAGATAGGILGGMAAGAATGLLLGSVVPGAGNVVGAVVGGVAGLAGGLIGAYYGGQAADAVGGAALDRQLNADVDNPLNAMAGQLQHLGYSKLLDKDRDGTIEAHEVRQFVGADGVRDLRAAAKNGLTIAEVTSELKQQLNENYGKQMNSLIAEAKQKGWAPRLNANDDDKFDISDIKENLKKSGMKLDANGDGTITGGEFIRAQTTPAAPAHTASGQAHR